MQNFSPRLNRLIDFVQFTHEFQQVIRVARRPHSERMENDAEHSYQLAMVAWFIIDQEKLPLNKERVFMYALAHDLVEVYAGDTMTFNKEGNETKQVREHAALVKIKERFPHFKLLVEVIEEFEKKKDEESIFVYALDKILPPIQSYLEEGKIWHEYVISHEDLLQNKNHKVALSLVVDSYWQELLKEFERKKEKLFAKKL